MYRPPVAAYRNSGCKRPRAPSPPLERELIANDLAVMAIDDSGQVSPSVATAGDMGHVYGPAFVAFSGFGCVGRELEDEACGRVGVRTNRCPVGSGKPPFDSLRYPHDA